MGADDELIPLVTSANVACGVHAGDPGTIRSTIRLALAHGVAVGAHPGYPDLVGFGRRELAMSPAELETSVLFQVSAVAGIARAEGGRLAHVKPHGALYHRLSADRPAAAAVATAIASLDPELALVAPAGSVLIEEAGRLGLAVLVEGFADRVYEPDGGLRSRWLPGAVHRDAADAAAQAVSIARDGVARASDGSLVSVPARTICIHSDTPGAADLARHVRDALAAAGIAVRAARG